MTARIGGTAGGALYHGADAELRGVFWDLRQIGDADGPKFSETVIRRLAATVLDGRAHEPLVFQLCHLARAAAFAAPAGVRGPGWLPFFCASGAGRSGWAAARLSAGLPAAEPGEPAVAAAADRVVLRYAGRAAPVTLSWRRMPLLAAFMEFLLNVLEFPEIERLLAPASEPELGWRALQDMANALSRAVYAWLRAHTRPVQESRDFEAIAAFLTARGGAGDFSAEDIDDDAVLGFWLAGPGEPASAFRTYRKTFRAFLLFAEALREAGWRAGIEAPGSLGAEPGEPARDPADPASPGLAHMRGPPPAAVWDWADGGDGDGSPLDALAGTGIKFLLAGEAKRLGPVEAHGPLLARLALSVLRDARFGHAQGRISQALRTGDAGAPPVSGAARIGYDDERAAFEALLAHLEDLAAAAYYVLTGAEAGGRPVDLAAAARGREALKGLRRQGFDGLRDGAPEAVAAMRGAAPAIVALRDRLAPLCARLRDGAPWNARQEEDDTVFEARFAQLYGMPDNSAEDGA